MLAHDLMDVGFLNGIWKQELGLIEQGGYMDMTWELENGPIQQGNKKRDKGAGKWTGGAGETNHVLIVEMFEVWKP